MWLSIHLLTQPAFIITLWDNTIILIVEMGKLRLTAVNLRGSRQWAAGPECIAPDPCAVQPLCTVSGGQGGGILLSLPLGMAGPASGFYFNPLKSLYVPKLHFFTGEGILSPLPGQCSSKCVSHQSAPHQYRNRKCFDTFIAIYWI